jgi:hypothetical protein
MQYRVTYEIDVDAETAMEAALAAEQAMKHGHYRPFLTVRNESTHVSTSVDLDEEKVVTE